MTMKQDSKLDTVLSLSFKQVIFFRFSDQS